MLHEIVQQYSKNDIIYAEGQGSAFLYLIEAGNVGVVFEKDQQLHLINKLGPKNFIGEVEFFSESRRLTSAVALSDVQVYCFKKADIMEVVKKCPDWVNDIMTTLGDRNYDAIKILVEHNIHDEEGDSYWNNKEKKEIIDKIRQKKNSL